MEASALTSARRTGVLAGRSPLLRLQKDDKLVVMIRRGHPGAFETLFQRYQSRLLSFCQHMLASREDAEDVLQEVFVAAYKAMLADDRPINVRPWLYRIARNRSLNHLRRPVPVGQDSMDIHPSQHGVSTADRVQKREEFRSLVADVGTLPDTQRMALLLREIDALSYEEIAQAMETTIPSVKSLLVRARISLAEASEARLLTCDEVRLQLAEAVEGLAKASAPARRHIRECEQCGEFRSQLRSSSKAMAAMFPVGLIFFLKKGLLAKLGIAVGAGAGGTAAAGSVGGGGAALTAAVGGGAATGGIGAITGAITGAIGTKAVAGVATAALLTAGAVEVTHVKERTPTPRVATSGPVTGGVGAPIVTAPSPVQSKPSTRKATKSSKKPARQSREKSPEKSTETPAAVPAAAGTATGSEDTAGDGTDATSKPEPGAGSAPPPTATPTPADKGAGDTTAGKSTQGGEPQPAAGEPSGGQPPPPPPEEQPSGESQDDGAIASSTPPLTGESGLLHDDSP